MTQEKRELAVGLQLSKDYMQITCFHSAMKEPVTEGAAEDTAALIPVSAEVSRILFPEEEQEEKPSGEEASGQDQPDQPDQTEGQEASGWTAAEEVRITAEFFSGVLSSLEAFSGWKNLRIMITVKKLGNAVISILPQALELLGMERRHIYLQDYLSSFYYYAYNQKKDRWTGDAALLEYEDSQMIGYILHIDQTRTPAIVTVEEAARQTVDESLFAGMGEEVWKREKDRLLFELLKRVFERRNVSVSYLMGDYYDGSWAVRSFQYLCRNRKAYRGGNLYTKGACYAAMERSGMLRMPDQLFLGADMIRENMGMMMRLHGKESYYSVISAGVNWYEAHHECEFIPDREKRITLITRSMTGGDEVQHILRLPHFPKRPNRATRLRMIVYFTSAKECRVEVEDMGFGGFYRPENKKWIRTIHFW